MPDSGGEFGYLTTAQWRSFQWAVHYSLRLVPWLYAAGNYSISDPDEARGGKSADVPLGMPATMLAAIEIERLSRELGEWDNLEDIANDVFGADIAVMFTREVQTATARWPFEDKPHRVEHVNCQGCGRLSLLYVPPEVGGDDATVRCRECGHEIPGKDFAVLVELIATSYQEAKLAS